MDVVDVAWAFTDQHVELVRACQSSEYEHTAVYVENVLNPIENVLADLIGYVGGRTGDPVPAFAQFSFPMRPTGPLLKRGGKRISGIRDVDQDDEIASGSISGILNAIAAGMVLPLNVDGSPLYHAVVRPIGNPVTSYVVSYVIGALFRQIGSQVSRKLSKGGGTGLGGLVPSLTTTRDTPISMTGFVDAEDWLEEMDTILSLRGSLGATPPSEVERFL
jgi:hypothetical protein